MRVWEFKHLEMDNQRWYVFYDDNGNLIVRFSPFELNFADWNTIDRLKYENKLEFIKEFEINKL